MTTDFRNDGSLPEGAVELIYKYSEDNGYARPIIREGTVSFTISYLHEDHEERMEHQRFMNGLVECLKAIGYNFIVSRNGNSEYCLDFLGE